MIVASVNAIITDLLNKANIEGGFPTSLVSTEQGLLVATAGEELQLENTLAALTAMFDDVVERSRTYVGLEDVDELAVRDRKAGRLIVRPLRTNAQMRLFLVVVVPLNKPWRRTTNQLCRALQRELEQWEALHGYD